MFLRMAVFALSIFIVSGCATAPKKQTAQPQAATTQESYPRYYDDDAWQYESDERPVAKKTYTEPTIQLSPKQIQRALKNAGFYQGPIDGKIGPKTKEAIIKFQKAKGLKPDGIVGKKTSAALNKYLSQ